METMTTVDDKLKYIKKLEGLYEKTNGQNVTGIC